MRGYDGRRGRRAGEKRKGEKWWRKICYQMMKRLDSL
jgi:hypothetical protein